MRTLLLAVLIPLGALAAPSKPVVALLPSASDAPELANLGLLIEARATELVTLSKGYTVVHAKQVAAMAEQEGLGLVRLSEPDMLPQARELLGADKVVTLVLEKTDSGMNLLGSVHDGGKAATAFTAKLPRDWPTALVQGSDAVAKAVFASEKTAMPSSKDVQPASKSEKALVALGRCWAAVLRQSVSVEAPVLFSEELDAALPACAEAVEADKTLRFAMASQALALAISGDDARAAQAVAAAGDAQLVPLTLARFWLVTRYQSNEAGVAFLRDAVKKSPGELLLRSYLGDTLSTLGQQEASIAEWNEYLALAPQSAYAQGRLSRSLARLGKHDEAIAAAKKGVALAPHGVDAQLQLASRLVDAGKYDEGIAVLKPLTDVKDARAELVLRLGWATWLKGDVEGAAKLFQVTLDRSKAPRDWRTRGRAHYNLSLVEAKRGHVEAAANAWKAALADGYKPKTVDPLLSKLDAKGDAAAPLKKEASLFAVTASGDVDPSARRLEPPPRAFTPWMP